jgi:hypothetical protein
MPRRLVRRIREQLKLPDRFTFDAYRHGGMTELEEAELTDGQGGPCLGTERKPLMPAMTIACCPWR